MTGVQTCALPISFDAKLEFDIKIIPYEGDDAWVDQVVIDVYKCLNADALPDAGDDCDYCKYREAARKFE